MGAGRVQSGKATDGREKARTRLSGQREGLGGPGGPALWPVAKAGHCTPGCTKKESLRSSRGCVSP